MDAHLQGPDQERIACLSLIQLKERAKSSCLRAGCPAGAHAAANGGPSTSTASRELTRTSDIARRTARLSNVHELSYAASFPTARLTLKRRGGSLRRCSGHPGATDVQPSQKERQITPSARRVLVALAKRGEATYEELRIRVRPMSQQGVTRAVYELDVARLITLTDRGVAAITDAGRDVLAS